MKKQIFSLAFLIATFGTASGSLSQAHATSSANLTGAGATFPYPVYSKWFSEYEKSPEGKGTRINYSSIGSGGGIRQFLDGTIDFGATDAPMTDQELAKAETPILHVPTVLGAVVVSYNLPEIKKQNLNLSGDVIADLFLGKITHWNDPKIAELNPGVKLPEVPVFIVHRSDGSGTTAVFSDYLAKVSPEWKEKVGAGKALKWPAGIGGKGNEGVTGMIRQTPGAIGYIELIYAESNHLPVAKIKNAAGKFVEPSVASVSAAAAGAVSTMPEDFRVSITNAPGKSAYPISAFTYLLVYKKMEGQKARALIDFIEWTLGPGQKLAPPLKYASLPESVVKKVRKEVKAIELK